MLRVPKVILLIESSRTSGRALLRGVADYSHHHGPWLFSWELTLIELLVIITIITVLAALLLPALANAKERGLRAACKNNLHQQRIALQIHTGDNGDKLPDLRYAP
jgi:hypothetical protein